MYVEDGLEGMLSACEKGSAGERYILGGHNFTFREYFNLIADIAGSRPPRINIPGFILPFTGSIMEMLFGKMGGDTGRLAAGFGYYSSRKAQNHLGYRITPIEDVIRAILKSISFACDEK